MTVTNRSFADAENAGGMLLAYKRQICRLIGVLVAPMRQVPQARSNECTLALAELPAM